MGTLQCLPVVSAVFMTSSLWTAAPAFHRMCAGQIVFNFMKRIITALVAATVMLLPVSGLALPEANTIEFSNCMLALPGTTRTASAQCGALDVPENPDEPDGRQISLNIAYAKATSPDAAPDPVFIFAGGPGQAATETWVMLRGMLNKIRKNRDIVMIDQRGTGSSNKLACVWTGEDDLNAEIDMDMVRDQTEECAKNLDGDPRYYTTPWASTKLIFWEFPTVPVRHRFI
jgi:hypothetical protein